MKGVWEGQESGVSPARECQGSGSLHSPKAILIAPRLTSPTISAAPMGVLW